MGNHLEFPMPDLALTSPLVLCLLIVVVGATSSLFPVSPVEPWLLAVAAVAPHWLLLPIVVLITVSSMSTKAIVFIGGRKIADRFTGRTRDRFERLRARVADKPNLQRGLLFVSSVVGFPPLYLVTALCGTLRMPLRHFLALATTGRGIRFSLLVFAPRLIGAMHLPHIPTLTMQSILAFVVAAIVGALSGLHAAIWGMYKDSAHEGFSGGRFARSVVIGAACGPFLQSLLQLDLARPGMLLLLFGLAYAMERAIVETWKTFFREEDQSKYFIPMQFTLLGRPVESRGARMLAGAVYILVCGIGLVAINALDLRAEATALSSAVAGLMVGLAIAVGGGWKDAPKEGFQLLKFFRSPAMTVAYALLLSNFTSRHLLIAAAAIGFERATAETWKKFFFPLTPPGKFAGKPVTHPHMLRRRQWFIAPYAAIWGGVVAAATLALSPT